MSRKVSVFWVIGLVAVVVFAAVLTGVFGIGDDSCSQTVWDFEGQPLCVNDDPTAVIERHNLKSLTYYDDESDNKDVSSADRLRKLIQEGDTLFYCDFNDPAILVLGSPARVHIRMLFSFTSNGLSYIELQMKAPKWDVVRMQEALWSYLKLYGLGTDCEFHIDPECFNYRNGDCRIGSAGHKICFSISTDTESTFYGDFIYTKYNTRITPPQLASGSKVAQ